MSKKFSDYDFDSMLEFDSFTPEIKEKKEESAAFNFDDFLNSEETSPESAVSKNQLPSKESESSNNTIKKHTAVRKQSFDANSILDEFLSDSDILPERAETEKSADEEKKNSPKETEADVRKEKTTEAQAEGSSVKKKKNSGTKEKLVRADSETIFSSDPDRNPDSDTPVVKTEADHAGKKKASKIRLDLLDKLYEQKPEEEEPEKNAEAENSLPDEPEETTEPEVRIINREKSGLKKGNITFFDSRSEEKESLQNIMKIKDRIRKENEPDTESSLVKKDVFDFLLDRIPFGGEQLVYGSELDALDAMDHNDLSEDRDFLPIRFRRYAKSGLGGGIMYGAFIIAVSIVLAVFGWMCAADVLAFSKDEVFASIKVEEYVPTADDILDEDGNPVDEDGRVILCNIEDVSQSLKNAGIINFEWLFNLYSDLSHAYAKIDPGTYNVSTNLDYRALVSEMQNGSDSQEITKITIPEGYTLDDIFELLDEEGICDIDELYDIAANYDFDYSWLEDIPLGDPYRLEGYLFPDTYEFYQGESAINAIDRFLITFHSIITQDMYHQCDELGITFHDAVIIASLIEKEAGADDDRSDFSTVIFNRLNSGMPLQLDSTINYITDQSTFDISMDELSIDSPYNTYLYSGLPYGPICNPGLASLLAATNPNDSDYWYWYAYDGLTYFFSDSASFNEFAAEHPY